MLKFNNNLKKKLIIKIFPNLKDVFLSKTLEDAIPFRRTVLRSFIKPNKDDNRAKI